MRVASHICLTMVASFGRVSGTMQSPDALQIISIGGKAYMPQPELVRFETAQDNEILEVRFELYPNKPPPSSSSRFEIHHTLHEAKLGKQLNPFLETVLFSARIESMEANCGATVGQWCLQKSNVTSNSDTNPTTSPNTAKDDVVVEGEGKFKVRYQSEAKPQDALDLKVWSVEVNNQRIERWETLSPIFRSFEFWVNYINPNSAVGDTSPLVYEDIMIRLKNADKNFGKNSVKKGKFKVPTAPTTTDGGKTWMLSRLELPPYTKPTSPKPRT